MRNKAAERAKTSYNSSTTGGSPPPPSSAGQGQQQVAPPPPPATSAHPAPVGGLSPGSQFSAAAAAEAILQQRQPSYSINGILGLQQADANANINKRKRDDSGKRILEAT